MKRQLILKLFGINLALVFIFLLALFLRTFLLNRFPIAITHDELDYIIQAKSLFYTGHAIPPSPFGIFSLGSKTAGNVLAELPSFLIAPLIGLVPFSQFVARLPYAIISSFTVIIIFFLFLELTKNKSLSILTTIALAVNPWSIHFGRTSFEFTFAIFFYLLGIYIIIKAKNWNIFYSFPFFILGFLSYHGFKLLFFPLIFIVGVWTFIARKKEVGKKPIVVLLIFSILIPLLYFITLRFQPGESRVIDLVFYDTNASTTVNSQRRLSIPGFQQSLFLNKFTYFSNKIIGTYIHTFSSDFLFVTGESRGAYSFWYHGPFYIIDFPLIILGLIGLYIVSKKSWFLVIGIIAISPIPSALTGGVSGDNLSWVIRSGLLFPFLAALSGIGVWFLISLLKKYNVIVGIVIAILYLVSIANFLNLYITRYPVYDSEGFFFSNKELARYIDYGLKENTNEKITIVVKEPKILFEEFLFYNNFYNKLTAPNLNNKIGNSNFSYQNITFTDKCPDTNNLDTLIYEPKQNCEKQTGPIIRILSPADAGTFLIIKNDNVCNHYNLSRYVTINKLSNFDIYSLSQKDFCESWISFL